MMKDVSGCCRLWHYTGATPSSRLISTFREERIDNLNENILKTSNTSLNQIFSCSCSYDGKRFITGGEDCHIRVYDLENRKFLRYCNSSYKRDKMDGHVRRIYALKYHPRGKLYPDYVHLFVSGGWDDTIQIWDDRYSHSLWLYNGPHVSGSDGFDIEGESNLILTSSWKRNKSILQVWKFNEKTVSEFYVNCDLTANGELRLRSKTNELDAQTTNSLYIEPVSEIAHEGFDQCSKGYTASWLGQYYIAFGGSDVNTLIIISRLDLSIIGTVFNLSHGVYSLAYIQPDLTNPKREIELAFASGTQVYVARLTYK